MALVFARLAARVPDVIALLPFLMRAWLYFSGVIYNIDVVTKHHPTLQVALNLNPAATYVELARTSMLSGRSFA